MLLQIHRHRHRHRHTHTHTNLAENRMRGAVLDWVVWRGPLWEMTFE